MALSAEQLQAWHEYCGEWAELYAAEVVAKKYPSMDPNIKAAIQFQIAHGEEKRLEAYGIVATTLQFIGPVNPKSGDTTGENENMGDSQIQRMADGSPGFQWFAGSDKNGVQFKVAMATEPMRAEHPRSWFWRQNCYFDCQGNRYAYDIGSILGMAESGIVNPSGK